VPEKKATTRKTTARKATTRKPARNATRPSKTREEAIAERAYFIALERGGSEFDNWLQAEQELIATK
jgi:Protein of unknown function (DUF2934)